MYLAEIITKWQTEDIKKEFRVQNFGNHTLLLADDQAVISNTTDNLWKVVYKLNQIVTENGLTIFEHKTKLITFKGRELIKGKICNR
jgi:hypothetical protein